MSHDSPSSTERRSRAIATSSTTRSTPISPREERGSRADALPPEPNGYLHLGHAKSICLNFGLAEKYGGKCNLRFGRHEPVEGGAGGVDSIQADVAWLGFKWDALFYASDFFEELYRYGEHLITTGTRTSTTIRRIRSRSTAARSTSPDVRARFATARRR